MIRWDGMDDFSKWLRAKPDQVKAASAAGLLEAGNLMMTESKARFVPVDTGVLRDSGEVGVTIPKGETIEVTLGFGGAAAAYAVVQHERLDFHHDVGQAKYLEQPVLENAGTMSRVLKTVLKRAWERR